MAKKAKVMKKTAPAKKTPLQNVKEKYGDKAGLVSQLAGKLERREGESKGDFQKRLSKVSSKKLMTLAARTEESEKYGGRSGLVDLIHDHHSKGMSKSGSFKEDKGFKAHLNKKTLGDLLDRTHVINKKTRAAN